MPSKSTIPPPPPQIRAIQETGRAIYANDCLDILSDPHVLPDESVDLIYLDPPFNSKSNYNLPFKGQYKKDSKPVMAFKDTWSWSENETEHLKQLKAGSIQDQLLADIVEMSKKIFKERSNSAISTSAYLLNMAIRLKPMKRVLKNAGSIYLHCDPTASHYLKMLMDVIFGQENFRNEIIWCYRGGGVPKLDFSRKHDVIIRYSKSKNRKFNVDDVRIPYSEESAERLQYTARSFRGDKTYDNYEMNPKGKHPEDWWEIQPIMPSSKERLGYPTQKPRKLLERIIMASSNKGDVVLDPFCGCGTTAHAAEMLRRKWIGIDISQFSAGLIRNRILGHYKYLNRANIPVFGCPLTAYDAKELARNNPFEFEKWVCGEVGAQGLFHNPGDRGADGGVDGIIPFYYSEDLWDQKPPAKTFAVVQVKGGKVQPDAVKALSTTVRESGGKCGIMICFDQYMNTVERNREKRRIKEITGGFDFIQGLSVENLINGQLPKIPYPYAHVA